VHVLELLTHRKRVPPPDPAQADTALQDELDRLKRERDADKAALAAAAQQVADAQRAADEAALKVMSAEQLAAKKAEDVEIMEALVLEQTSEQESALKHKISQNRDLQAQVAKLHAELQIIQQAAVAAPPAVQAAVAHAAQQESENIVLDEHATRMLIDAQLRAAGWDADSDKLTFKRGVRPQKGRNVAIAEWPTRVDNKDGRADYVLFAGLTAIAVIEAKRKHKNISGNIPQAQRYSKGYLVHADEAPPEGSPWGDHKIPLVFATNGRPYIKQFAPMSGIWFLDARRGQNHPRVRQRTSARPWRCASGSRSGPPCPPGCGRSYARDRSSGSASRRRRLHCRWRHRARWRPCVGDSARDGRRRTASRGHLFRANV